MQLTRVLYTDKVDPRKSLFRRNVKADHNFKTTWRQTSSDSRLRNDVRAIQNLIRIGRQIKPTSVYNDSPTRNIIKHTRNY